MNSTRNKTTTFTPAELLFGSKLQTDGDGLCDTSAVVDVMKIRAEAAQRLEEKRRKKFTYLHMYIPQNHK